MKKYMLWILILVASYCEGRQVNCMSSGNWGNTSTWSATPTCGDTLFIPSGRTVTVDGHYTYSSSVSSMKIIVGGTLQFQNGYKLRLPCNSQVEILVGALLKKATSGGGFSTLIEICQTTVWSAGVGPIHGYKLLFVGVLPVTWLDIRARRISEGIKINWETASEFNNDYYIIERANDESGFSPIGYYDGAGNASVNLSYSFIDDHPPRGSVYYKICQVDFDGNKSYSDIVVVKEIDGHEFSLIDVRSIDNHQYQIKFIEPEFAACSYQLLDLSGRIVSADQVEAGKGIIERQLYCNSLNRGEIYLLQLSNGKKRNCKKFIIN
jgi:hypothetical protein